MKAKNEILKLGERHAIETPHVIHVAGLAMDIFNGFSPLPEIQDRDRDLLYAAALLHDIGYAADPANHVGKGVSILLEHPLSCFSPKDWRAIAAVVMLHQRDWRARLEDEWFAEFGHKRIERIKILAAILRIADGLDHGRIQDARVLYCRRGKQSDKVGVGWTWYSGNIPWAEGKADLWEALFKRPFKFESRPEPQSDLFGGAVGKKDSALSAARKLLNTQHAVMRDQLPNMLENCDPESLHAYRVALRRFRRLLRMFKSVLPDAGVPALDRKLDRLLDKLGPIRDAHVQLDVFRNAGFKGKQADEVYGRLEADARGKNAALIKLLQSSEHRKTDQRIGRLLRVEIPEAERSGSYKAYSAVAEKQLHKALRALPDTDISTIRNDPARMHEVRKRCRRGRYCAEFAVPAQEPEVGKIARLLGTADTALGRARDLQLAMETPGSHGIDGAQRLEERCEEEWQQFFTAWKELIKRVNELK